MANYVLSPSTAIMVDSGTNNATTGSILFVNSNRKIAVAFNNIPPELARKKAGIAALQFRIDRQGSYSAVISEIIDDWGVGTNYNTYPAVDSGNANAGTIDDLDFFGILNFANKKIKGISITSNSYFGINISMTSGSWTPMQLLIGATAVVPKPINRMPVNNAYVPFDNDTVFKWDVGTDEQMYDPDNAILTQTSAVFRWRYKGESTTHDINISDGTKTVTIPANTFDDECDIQWQVIITSNDEATGDENVWFDISTSDNISTAQIIGPSDTYIDGTVDNTFSWRHIINSGTTQSGYDLQILSDGVWTDYKSETTSNQFAIVPADTFPSGQNQWRVRTYNSDGAAGEWSEAALILVRAAPAQPMITSVSNAARPVVSWQSLQQQGYRVTVYQDAETIYDSGIIAGVDKAYTINQYLHNGTYTVKLVIYNQYGLASPAASYEVAIEAPKPYKPTLTAESVRNGVKLTVTDGTNTIYILRDGVPVKKLVRQSEWTDYLSIGSHDYTARAVDSSDNFEDSAAVMGVTLIDTATIAAVDSPGEYIELSLRRDNPVAFAGKLYVNQALTYYAGREMPVAEFDEHTTQTRELAHSVLTLIELAEFKTLIMRRKTLIYRNNYGDIIHGVVSDVSFGYDKISCDFSFTLTEVSFTEEINYD